MAGSEGDKGFSLSPPSWEKITGGRGMRAFDSPGSSAVPVRPSNCPRVSHHPSIPQDSRLKPKEPLGRMVETRRQIKLQAVLACAQTPITRTALSPILPHSPKLPQGTDSACSHSPLPAL